jgi:tetratricopeptide (TPR) repeat protein
VALKVLPRQALLDERHLARFKRESQIASRLHHTNIVQVYGVGEQDGFHYYVMQYVRGAGLDRVIAHLRRVESAPPAPAAPVTQAHHADTQAEGEPELVQAIGAQMLGQDHIALRSPPLPNPEFYRAAARMALQVAEALAYAHAQGTLHRDVKPANLLLDDQGVVWVADFGLARATHTLQVTQTGDLTGTLRYMAPECLSGEADERGDIYSLGLTLYELLTLRPAFDEADQSKLMHQISQEAPARPCKINPFIPKDLETIVLKAIAHEPWYRYASAAAMAEDLRRFLEDRPIAARPIAPPERLWRWCRRSPAVAGLTLTTVLLAVVVAVVATVGYVRTQHAYRAEERAYQAEAGEHRKAQATAALAQEALDRIFERLGPAPVVHAAELTLDSADGTTISVPSQPVISRATAALLEEMLPFYDRLAAQSGGDAGLRRRGAEANGRVGDIRQRLGQYDQAIAAYERAIGMYEKLPNSIDPDYSRTKIAALCNEIGHLYRSQEQRDRSRQAHLRALELLQAAGASAPPDTLYELARTHYFLGTRLPPDAGTMRPRPEGAPPPQGGPPLPGGAPPRRDNPPPLNGEGRLSTSERAELETHLRTAQTILQPLVEQSPANPEFRRLLALCHRERAALLPPRDRGLVDVEMDQATRLLEQLVQDFPQSPDYSFDLGETYAYVDSRGPPQGPQVSPATEDRLHKALAISVKLTADYPQVPEYMASQAHIYHKLGELLRQTRRWAEAEASDRKAVEVQTALVAQFADAPSHQAWLAAFRNSLADVLIMRERWQEARQVLTDTVALLNRILETNPNLVFLHALAAESYRNLAAVLRHSGDVEGALQAEQQAQGHRRNLPPGPAETKGRPGPEGRLPPD